VAGQPPDKSVLSFYHRTQVALLRSDGPLRLFVGYWEDEPVAAAEAFLSEAMGGVYSVITIPSHRRRGIGAAMTSRVAQEAFGSGLELVSLQASPEGCRLYEKLGFRAVCQFTVFQ
jgi:predicted GNAT family acetyltransferase